MALQGHVKTISLIEIFQFLSANLHTGTLTIKSRSLSRIVFFVEGSLHLPRTQAFTVGRLGDYLVRQGKIGMDRVYSALEEQKSTSKLLGEILLERGDVTAQVLEDALRHQYEEEIYQVFIWDDATFVFEKNVVPDAARSAKESIVLKADSLLMEAARRTDEWGRLISVVPSLRAIYSINDGAQPEVERVIEVKKISFDLALINGERSVQEIFTQSREGQFQIAELLYTLIEGKLIAPAPATSVPDLFRQAVRAGNFNFAVALIQHGFDLKDCDPAVIRELEATLFKTRTFIKSTDRVTIPIKRQGGELVEFALTAIRNVMSGTISFRTGTYETLLHVDKNAVVLVSPDRDLLELERFISQDTRISPIDVKKMVMQFAGADTPVTACIVESGIIQPRAWRQHLVDRFLKEIYTLALTTGVEAVFIKSAVAPEVKHRINVLELDPHFENTFFELTEAMSRWVERAQRLPFLDMVLAESGYETVDSPVMGYVNGKSSVRDILERSRMDPVKAFEALVELMESDDIRALNGAEMIDAVQHFLTIERPRDALKLCRAAQASNLDVETFAAVEEAIIEEHGQLDETEKEYRLFGEAGDFSLAEVLQSLHNHQKSGTLKITDGASEREIYFQQGRVFYLRTEDAEKASFGEQFLDFDLQDMTEGLFGDEKIPTGEVSEEDIPEELCEQIKEEIYDTFIWDNAGFTFSANFFPAEFLAPSETTTKLGLSTDRFMMQAVSMIQDWEAIQKAFSMKTIFKFVSSDAKMSAVSELGTPEVLYLIDGRLQVKSIIRRSGFDKLRVCKLLFDLLEAKWIQPLTIDECLETTAAAIEKNDNAGALTFLAFALELEPDNKDVQDAIDTISGSESS